MIKKIYLLLITKVGIDIILKITYFNYLIPTQLFPVAWKKYHTQFCLFRLLCL